MIEKKLPKDWKIVKVGKYVISTKGKKPKRISKEKTNECHLPYVNIKAFEKGIIDEYTDGVGCVICEEGDFLMVWDGSRSGYVGKAIKGALGSTLVKLNFPDIDNNYAYYFLQSKYLEINTRAKGVGIPHVDPNLLWNYELLIPPPEIQKQIVSKIEELFSELDKGIEDLKTALQQIKIYRQSVLKWTFEGKERILFENIIQSSQNGLSKRSGLDGEEFNVLRLADIKNNNIVIDSPRKIKMTSHEILKYKLNENDLVCIRVNGSKDLVGKIVFITSNDNKNKWAFCDHFIRFTIKDNFISKFIYHYFQTIEVRKFIHDNMVTSAGQNTVSQVTIKNVTVPTCNLEEQQRIVQEIESRLSVADKMEESITQSLQQAEALRQSILKKAFSGDLV